MYSLTEGALDVSLNIVFVFYDTIVMQFILSDF